MTLKTSGLALSYSVQAPFVFQWNFSEVPIEKRSYLSAKVKWEWKYTFFHVVVMFNRSIVKIDHTFRNRLVYLHPKKYNGVNI